MSQTIGSSNARWLPPQISSSRSTLRADIFDKPEYESVRVLTPGQFLNERAVAALVKKLTS